MLLLLSFGIAFLRTDAVYLLHRELYLSIPDLRRARALLWLLFALVQSTLIGFRLFFGTFGYVRYLCVVLPGMIFGISGYASCDKDSSRALGRSHHTSLIYAVSIGIGCCTSCGRL